MAFQGSGGLTGAAGFSFRLFLRNDGLGVVRQVIDLTLLCGNRNGLHGRHGHAHARRLRPSEWLAVLNTAPNSKAAARRQMNGHAKR